MIVTNKNLAVHDVPRVTLDWDHLVEKQIWRLLTQELVDVDLGDSFRSYVVKP